MGVMGDENGAQSPNPHDKRVQGWSKSELIDLLQNIDNCGSRDITSIAKSFPTKTTEQIRKVLEYHRELIIPPACSTAKRSVWNAKTKTTQAPVPLSKWAKFLHDKFSPEELHTDTAAAVRFLANVESIPPAAQTNNIDFRKVYHALADALEGKPIQDDDTVAAVLIKCVADTALTSKAFMRAGALQNAVQYIDFSDKSISVLPRPSDNIELATLRQLASQKAYNPLNIPEQYLKPT